MLTENQLKGVSLAIVALVGSLGSCQSDLDKRITEAGYVPHHVPTAAYPAGTIIKSVDAVPPELREVAPKELPTPAIYQIGVWSDISASESEWVEVLAELSRKSEQSIKAKLRAQNWSITNVSLGQVYEEVITEGMLDPISHRLPQPYYGRLLQKQPMIYKALKASHYEVQFAGAAQQEMNAVLGFTADLLGISVDALQSRSTTGVVAINAPVYLGFVAAPMELSSPVIFPVQWRLNGTASHSGNKLAVSFTVTVDSKRPLRRLAVRYAEAGGKITHTEHYRLYENEDRRQGQYVYTAERVTAELDRSEGQDLAARAEGGVYVSVETNEGSRSPWAQVVNLQANSSVLTAPIREL